MTGGVSGYYPTRSTLAEFATGAAHNLRVILEQRGSIVERHNAFTDHCLALLFRATGHRPVRDPFQSLQQFELSSESGLLLIQDKVSFEHRGWRTVALPQIACDQVRHYKSYLSTLATRLASENQGSAPQWLEWVPALLAGEEVPVPLFFYLSSNLDWISARPATIQDRWAGYWPLPVGFLRHVMATELSRVHVPATGVQLQLGHADGLNHPLGRTATESAALQLAGIARCIDETMEAEGWMALRPPLRYAGAVPNIQARSGSSSTPQPVIGHHRRANIRHERLRKAATVVRRLVVEAASGRESWALVDSTEFERFVHQVIDEAKSEGCAPNHALRMLYQLIRSQPGGKDLLRRVAPVRVIESEPSPFGPDSLRVFAAARQARNAFVDYLEAQGKSFEELNVDQRLCEVLISGALLSGIADPDRLFSIPEAIFRGLHRYGDVLCVDLPLTQGKLEGPVYRWYPDPVSRSLIIGIAGVRQSQPHWVSDRSSLGSQLKKTRYSLPNGESLTVKRLAALARAAGRFELPGYVAACLSGETPNVSLPPPAWYRVVADVPLEVPSQPATPIGRFPADLHVDISGRPRATVAGERKRMKLSLNRMVRHAQGQAIKGNERPNRRHKKAFAESLRRNYLQSDSDWSQLPTLIAMWAVHLCKSGTPTKKNLKFSTVRKYVYMIADSLLRIDYGNEEFLGLGDVAYEEIYTRALESQHEPKRPVLLGRIQAFHDFLVLQYLIDEPDWSALRAHAGRDGQRQFPDANFLTEAEYLHVLDCLRFAEGITELDRIQHAALLLLGFRFGLRFGEAWRLKYREIQHDPEEGDLYVWVRSSAYGEVKTIAGTRVVQNLEGLDSRETKILEEILSFGDEGFGSTSLFPLMARSTVDPRPANRALAVQQIHAAMRSVTGDPSIRYHHLRHGWATRMVTYAHHVVTNIATPVANSFLPANIASSSVEDFFGPAALRKPLRSIATALGHADEVTTLASYSHSLDLIASSLVSRNVPELPDYATSYALGVPYATVRSRRRRQSSPTWISLDRQAKQSIQLPSVAVAKDRKCPAISTESAMLPMSIIDIDTFLMRLATSTQPADELAIIHGLSLGVGNRIHREATRIEQVSGYDRYMVLGTLGDPVISSGGDALRPTGPQVRHTGAARLRPLWTAFDEWLSSLSDAALASAREGAEQWAKTLNPASGTHLASSVRDAESIVTFYASLPISVTGKILVPTSSRADILKGELRSLGWPVVIADKVRMARAKARQERHGRVEISVAGAHAEALSPGVLHRTIFLVCVRLSAFERSAEGVAPVGP